MVDTTCPDKRVLHYARSNFKNNFDITNIATDSAALVDYKAPGAFGETGDKRQYSFLMYINPQRKQITSLKTPGDGEAFDVEKFQTDNGFQDATGAIGMEVKLGGQANCGAGGSSGGQQSAAQSNLPSAVPSAAPPRSSAANAGPTSSAAAVSSTPQVPSTSAAASQRASSAPRASATPSSPSNNSPSNGNNGSNNNATSATGAEPSGPAAASSDVQGDTPAMSTVVLSSAGAGGGVQASRTPSASLAQQSTSSALMLSANDYGMLASLFAIVGLAMW
jgi:hypothetical protein